MHHRVRRALLGTLAALVLPRAVGAQPAGPPPADAGAPAVEPLPPPPPEPAEPAKPEPAPAKPGLETPSVTWEPYGYLRMQYRIMQNDPNVQFVGRDDGFELQNARFGVRGAVGARVTYAFAIDGAVDERVHLNVPDGRLRVGLKDAFADVALAGKIAVRGGFFETLVDPDLDDDTTRAFVDRPLETRGVRPTYGFEADGLTPGRSLGAALRLEPVEPAAGADIGFELAVQNGADEYASDNDNDTPAASVSVLLRLPKGSALVASGRYNRRTVGDLPLRRDEDDLQGSAGLRLALGPVDVAGAVVFQRTTFPTTGGPVQNGYGAHAQLLVKIPGSFPAALGYRFGILDPSSLILTDRVMEHTAGGVVTVPALHMRVQLQAVHVSEQTSRTLSNDRVQLAAEVAL